MGRSCLRQIKLWGGSFWNRIIFTYTQPPADTLKSWYQYRLTDHLGNTMVFFDYQLCQTGVDPIQIPTSNIISSNNIKFSPNPATEEINIELYIADLGLVDINILDSYGRVVKQTSLSNTNRTTIPTAELAQGVYYCQLKKGKEIIATKRFVIIR